MPKEAITELRQIHRQQTGEHLTDGQAEAMAQDLFRLLLAVYEPIPKRWLEELAEKNRDNNH